MKKWFLRTVQLNRAAIYIVVCGITTLIAIPIVKHVVAGNGWAGFVLVMAINLAVAACVVLALHPIVSSLPKPIKPPKQPRRKPQKQHLSRFAKKRIQEELPDLLNSPLIFEVKLPPEVLFIPFKIKTRSEINKQLESLEAQAKRIDQVKSKWRQRGLRRRLERRMRYVGTNMIYTPALRFLLSIILLAAAVVFVQQLSGQAGIAAAIILLPFLIYCLVRFVPLYHRWSRWHYYRLIAFGKHETEGHTTPAQLVALNKPRLLPGGGAPAIPIAKIQTAWTSTAPKHESEESKLSIVAGWWHLRYILVDLIGEEAAAFEYMGPFLEAVYFNDKIKALIAENNDL